MNAFIKKHLPWFLFGAAILIWLIGGFSPSAIIGFDKADKLADSFGTVNALFSALAFAGVIYAIVLQSKELQLQRQELEETREELKRSADAQEQTQQSLFLTAYLNSVSAALSAYEPEMLASSDKRFQTAKMSHQTLMMELCWMLNSLRKDGSPPKTLPTKARSVQAHLLVVANNFECLTRAKLARRESGDITDAFAKLRDNLIDVIGLLGNESDEELIRNSLESLIPSIENIRSKIGVPTPNSSDPEQAFREWKQKAADMIGNICSNMRIVAGIDLGPYEH